MKITDLQSQLASGALFDAFATLYGAENAESQIARACALANLFSEKFGTERDVSLFTVAGRSELSGNHTDHNHGKVLAASINLDILALASPNDQNVIRLYSDTFGMDTADLNTYKTPDPNRFGTSASLIAGMAYALSAQGWMVGGFDGVTDSLVPGGSGLSSSAAFEDMVGTILNHLYNDGKVDNVTIAKMAQFSENVFFGKPCGLMDQTACAVGGIVAIDFANPDEPIIEKLDFDMTTAGYRLCIVMTGGNHADLTDDYAAIPTEMKAVAAALGHNYLNECRPEDLIAAIPALRTALGDRPILRALHFFKESERVAAQILALRTGDWKTFLEVASASGRSSFCYLQNVWTPKNVQEQGLSLALCLAELTLSPTTSAWRVHGGGFAGTIQAYVPAADAPRFAAVMNAAFGKGACRVLSVRQVGAAKIL